MSTDVLVFDYNGVTTQIVGLRASANEAAFLVKHTVQRLKEERPRDDHWILAVTTEGHVIGKYHVKKRQKSARAHTPALNA